MRSGDFSRVERDALAQVEAGAHVLDVNAGIPMADEPAILARAIAARPVARRRAARHRFLDRRGAGGGPRRLPRQGPRELGDRRGGPTGARAAARPPVRRGGRRDQQRRHRHLRGSRRAVRGREEDRGARGGPRHPARGRHRRPARHADRRDALAPAARCSRSCAGSARSCASTRPAARRTSASGLPNREGINGPFLAMAISNGLTSAITNPLLADVREAIMAADVLMGNDAECGRWIRAAPRARWPRAKRRRPARQPATRAALAGVRRRDAVATSATPHRRARTARHLHAVGPPGARRRRHDRARRGARPRRRHRLGLRRARHLRPLPGHAGARALSRSTRSRRRRRTSRRAGAVEQDYVEHATGLAPDRRLSCLAHVDGRRRSSTCRPRARSTARSCARASRSAISRSIRSCASTTSRSSRRPSRRPSGDLARLQEALAREWNLHDLETDLEVDPRAPARADGGRLPRHGRRPRRPPHHRRSGRASTTGRSGSRSTSGRRRSPPTSPTCTMAPCSRPTA